VERISGIFDIRDTSTARKQIRDYFETYFDLPQAVVACPGGYLRSQMFATYLEANKLAICPLNVEIVNGVRTFKAISFNNLKFIIKNKVEPCASSGIDSTRENLIDVVVLSGIPTRCPIEKISKVVSEVPGKAPVLVLGGEAGNFYYFCQGVTID